MDSAAVDNAPALDAGGMAETETGRWIWSRPGEGSVPARRSALMMNGRAERSRNHGATHNRLALQLMKYWMTGWLSRLGSDAHHRQGTKGRKGYLNAPRLPARLSVNEVLNSRVGGGRKNSSYVVDFKWF